MFGNKFKEAMMIRTVGAIALAAALLSSATVPSQAANGRNAAAAVGFGAGALVGAAAASAAYGPSYGYYGYGYGPGYAYEPGYAYAPAPAYVYDPAPSYVYARPAPAYVQPAPAYVERPAVVQTYAAAPAPRGCWVATDSSRNFGYYGPCKTGQTDQYRERIGANGMHNKSLVKP
jgi:hypothetical protein